MQLPFYMLHMVPLSRSHLSSMDIPFVSCIASMQPRLFYQITLYICLSQSTMSIAWSVCHVPTYLNDNTSCIFSNLNLLDFPKSPRSLKVSMLLLSVCSLVNLRP